MNEQIKANNTRYFFSSLAFVLISIGNALAIGFGVGVLSTFVYLVIIFPILIGLSSGKALVDTARQTKVRNASLIKWTAILSAFIIFITIFYVRFLGAQVTAARAFGGLSDENLKVANIVVNYELEEKTGHPGFIGYILFKADQGVFIGRMFRDNALNLGPIFTWLYWLAELGAIAFIMTYTSRDISKVPFCENCNTWYPGKRHIGGVRLGRELEIRNFMKLHDYPAVGKMLEENVDIPGLELYLQSCKTCEKSDSLLTVTKTGMEKGKLAFTDLLNTTLTPRENKLLLEEINNSVTASGSAAVSRG